MPFYSVLTQCSFITTPRLKRFRNGGLCPDWLSLGSPGETGVTGFCRKAPLPFTSLTGEESAGERALRALTGSVGNAAQTARQKRGRSTPEVQGCFLRRVRRICLAIWRPGGAGL